MEEIFQQLLRDLHDAETELEKEIASITDSRSIIGRTKLKEQLLDRSHKVKLPDSYESRMEKLPLIYPHPMLGKMTKIDWLFSVPFHSLRHTEQIREVKSKLIN